MASIDDLNTAASSLATAVTALQSAYTSYTSKLITGATTLTSNQLETITADFHAVILTIEQVVSALNDHVQVLQNNTSTLTALVTVIP